MEKLPKTADLLVPTLQVLSNGGPLKYHEIEKEVIRLLQIPDDLSTQVRQGNRTELGYRLSWARTRAKSLNLISRSPNGEWQIVEKGKDFLKTKS
jgi:hypothetical protein